ncbi:hypothetical protein R5R35_011726 [Gryllus longicercus]|uniref:Uncharacterized protein n=1 Tax=Gryllus longicercus TaxID=2509291 RepID=A0AAN9V0X6_9ORTH
MARGGTDWTYEVRTLDIFNVDETALVFGFFREKMFTFKFREISLLWKSLGKIREFTTLCSLDIKYKFQNTNYEKVNEEIRSFDQYLCCTKFLSIMSYFCNKMYEIKENRNK